MPISVRKFLKRAFCRTTSRVFRGHPGPIFEVFHTAWYDAEGWKKLKWFGVPILKNPFDLMRYQEVLFTTKPDFIIECGANLGGSTLYFAHVLDAIGQGTVISIDLEAQWEPAALAHPRVTPISGSSTSAEVLRSVRAMVSPGNRCFVILDSDHRRDHVLMELQSYCAFVQVGDYLVVEDTNVNGHPVRPEYGPGPYEAVLEFLRQDSRFEPDRDCEFPFTFAPNGWLRRVRP